MASKETGEIKEKVSLEQASLMISKVVLETEGVAGLADMPPISNGVFISNFFGKMDIDISINIFYGYNIPEISWDLQECVKKMLIEHTNLEPQHINIHVQGVNTDNVRIDHMRIPDEDAVSDGISGRFHRCPPG